MKLRNNPPDKTKSQEVFWWFLKYMRPFRVSIFFMLLGTVALTVLQLASTFVMKPMTDTVLAPSMPLSTSERLHNLNFLILLLVVIFMAQTFLNAMLNFQKSLLEERLGARIRDEIFRKLHALPMAFYNQQSTGELQALSTWHVKSIQGFIVTDMSTLLTSLLTFIGIGIVLAFLNMGLMALLLIPIPVTVVVTYLSGKKAALAKQKFFQKFGRMSSSIYNNIVGAAVIKTNAAENFEYCKFEKSNTDVWHSWREGAKVTFLYGSLAATVLFLSSTVVRWAGGRLIISDQLSLGDLMVFIGYSVQFLGPVRSLSYIYDRFQTVVAAGSRIYSVLNQEAEIRAPREKSVAPALKGGVRFERVTFGYTPDKDVLREVSFDARPGETIGITGPSGAGKTTMISLLCRLFEPREGTIYLDSYDMTDIDKRCLRSQIGLVLQDTLLFRGTIAENIAYAHPAAHPAAIVEAAKASGAHSFICRMPEAYDTIIGERGSGLSGGEKQRISIARALLRNPRIIIFDEATSSLDSATELYIQRTIKSLGGKHTVFLITHRVSMLNHVDKLIILDRGLVRAAGSYKEVIDGDVFQELIQRKEIA